MGSNNSKTQQELSDSSSNNQEQPVGNDDLPLRPDKELYLEYIYMEKKKRLNASDREQIAAHIGVTPLVVRKWFIRRHMEWRNKWGLREAYTNEKLPYNVLFHLFSYFSMPDDFVTAQRVCRAWKSVALDECFWNKFTLTLKGTPQDERKIGTMPGLKNINGKAKNELVNLILENVIELDKLNVKFEPPLTFSQVQALMEKYPKLQSIYLKMYTPDTKKCLDILKTSKHITEIYFDFPDSEFVSNSFRSERVAIFYLDIINVFNDSTESKRFPGLSILNFSTLAKTNLLNPPSHLLNVVIKPKSCLYYRHKLFTEQRMTDMVSWFIWARKHHLQLLDLQAFPDLNMTETVSMCRELKKLNLSIDSSYSGNLYINLMKELQSLSLKVTEPLPDNKLALLRGYFHKGSWANLTHVSFVLCKNTEQADGGILNAILKNVKTLKNLLYSNENSNTSESELTEVGNLCKLTHFSLFGLQSISEVGMSYIGNCSSLQVLNLVAATSSCDNMKYHVCNLLCRLSNLNFFSFQVLNNKKSIRLSRRKAVELFITRSQN